MKNKTIKITLYAAILLFIAYLKAGHINMPGHGNQEEQNLEKAVSDHVFPTLSNGETIKFGYKYSCNDYMENGEARFSAIIVYHIVASNGEKTGHTAHIVCNEDKTRILKWQEIKNNSLSPE